MKLTLISAETWERHHEEIIKQYGKKGRSFILCRCKKARMCQNPNNRHQCFSANYRSCVFALQVIDGLIEV